jgi:hypothetical protein
MGPALGGRRLCRDGCNVWKLAEINISGGAKETNLCSVTGILANRSVFEKLSDAYGSARSFVISLFK